MLEDCIFAEDGGKSGKDMKHRTEFQHLIALSKKKPKPFDAILVWKFSRFARNQEESIVVKSMLQKQGIEVISISEPIPDNAFGSLIERIIEWSDEYYLTNLSEEVKRGMKERASRGEPVTPPPIGYSLVNGQWEPNEQADIVRNIFNDYLNGMGQRAIAKKYAEIGLRTKRGNIPDNRFIEYILHNPAYIGKIRWSKDGRAASSRHYDNPNILVFDGKHEPIVNLEIFNAVQKKLDDTKMLYPKYQRPEGTVNTMFKGLVRCSNCGATLSLSSLKSRNLQCHNYNRGSCLVSHHIAEKRLTDTIITYLKQAIDGDFPLSVQPKQSTIEANDDLVNCQKRLANEEKKLERVKLAYESGIDTIEEYRVNKAKITQTIEHLKQEVAKKPDESINISDFKKRLQNVVEIITDDTQTIEAKNLALRSVIEKIIYKKSQKTFDIIFYS